MSCNDCVHKNKCLERSRDYPCISYRRKDGTDEWQQKRTLKTGLKNTLRNMVVGGSNTGVVQLTQKGVFLIYW